MIVLSSLRVNVIVISPRRVTVIVLSPPLAAMIASFLVFRPPFFAPGLQVEAIPCEAQIV